MKSTFLLPLLSLLLNLPLLSQTNTSHGTISGTVYDSNEKAALSGVNIQIEGTDMGTVTEDDGKFLVSDVPPGTYNLLFSYIGYADFTIEKIVVSENQKVDVGKIDMEEEALSLSQVVVAPGSFSVMGGAPLSKQTLTAKDLKNMSWAEDITRAVTRLPGVASTDFSSKFTVRGGEDNEVLMILDGMELYEPFHQRDFVGGLFAIVDIETIQSIDLLTGGFGAEFGQRQSGVFQMRTKQVPDNQRTTSVGLSVMNARFYTDGHFSDNKGKYLFSARRGVLDLLFKAVGADETIPTFYDSMFKLKYQLNNKHSLSIHGLYAGDKTAVRDIKPDNYDRHDTEYTNAYSWLTLHSAFSPSVSARSLLYIGHIAHTRNGLFHKRDFSDKGDFSLLDKRSYLLYGFKQDWSFDISKKFALKTGFDIRQLNADYNYDYFIEEIRINNQNENLFVFSNEFEIKTKPSGQLYNVYASGRFMLLPKLFLEAGLRYDEATYANDQVVSPRASLAYAVSKSTFLRAAYGQYYQSQFINNLDVNHNGTEFNPAELSTHYVLGFEHLFKNKLSMRMEAYYKDISNLSPIYQNLRDPWEVYPEMRNDVVKLNVNNARARGIELFLKYDVSRKVSWWFSYALAKAEDNIRNIEFDALLTERTGWQLRPFNQFHTVYLDVNYRPNPKWAYNFSFAFHKGWPRTTYEYEWKRLPEDNVLAQETAAAFPQADGYLHFYQRHKEFNGVQYPAYHRADLRVNRHWQVGNGRISAFLHVINLYNRSNLRKFDLGVTGDDELPVPDGQGGYIIIEDNTNWFGITPVIGASWEF